MTFNDFIENYNLKNKATSNIKIQQVLFSLILNDVGTYLGDGPFSGAIGIVNLHPFKGAHWASYKDEKYFDSYGCVCPKKLSNFIIKRNGFCFCSEYQIQKNDSFCASYLFIHNLLDKSDRH